MATIKHDVEDEVIKLTSRLIPGNASHGCMAALLAPSLA